ncbi:hypothetical protein LCGC14_1561540 [marine sediment metagenome]|uniref:LamG-like jellyroll fold domain-containing protein n=1 Tax=marine sediment metagenome TaxID=412755 RepID=A0A0F9IMD2_9ZZZZ
MNRLKRAISIALIAMMLLPMVALAADTWKFFFPMSIVDTSAAARTSYPVLIGTTGQSMIDAGYINATGTDTRMKLVAVDQKYMLSTTEIATVVGSLPALGQVTHDFYTGYAPVATVFPVIVGEGGYVTISDAAGLEPGNDFEIEIDGYIFTDTGADDDYLLKTDAFNIYNSAADEISAVIPSPIGLIPNDGIALDYVRTNSDWTSIPDAADFSFTDGGGNDEPFSIIAWVYYKDASSGTIISKTKAGAQEWYFKTGGADVLDFTILKLDGSAHRGRLTAAITAYEGLWTHFAATYDGSEVVGGFNIYINGVDSDTTDTTAGAYTGMTNGTALVSIGAHLEGTSAFQDAGMERIKVYDIELSPAQVLADFNGTHLATNLVAYWKFDEGAGNPADSSGNGHNATANLADWVANPTVTAINQTNGEHTINVSADTVNLEISIDGAVAGDGFDSTPLAGASVPDNGNDWVLMKDTISYMDKYSHNVGGALVTEYEWMG